MAGNEPKRLVGRCNEAQIWLAASLKWLAGPGKELRDVWLLTKS
jgi:hypothetical protein